MAAAHTGVARHIGGLDGIVADRALLDAQDPSALFGAVNGRARATTVATVVAATGARSIA